MSTDNKEQDVFSFSLEDIEILEKSFSYLPKKADKKFDFDIGLKISINAPKKQSVHVINVSIVLKGEKKKVAAFSIGCIFEINDLENLVIIEKGETTLPQALLNLLNAVVIGTTRGIIYSELRGTVLDGTFLPVLDPRGFEHENKNTM